MIYIVSAFLIIVSFVLGHAFGKKDAQMEEHFKSTEAALQTFATWAKALEQTATEQKLDKEAFMLKFKENLSELSKERIASLTKQNVDATKQN